MSKLIVEVCRVDKVSDHPNADKMAVATIKGWKTCIKRNQDGSTQFVEGDSCVFIPPDAVLSKELGERLGVTNYLKSLNKNPDGTRSEGGRVSVARLRGQPSYGLIVTLDVLPVRDDAWHIGDDVADVLGITKWEPPMSCTDGDAETPHAAFHRYYSMENLLNFPNLIQQGEEVVISEKIHGKNCRVGYLRDQADDGSMKWTWMAGSHDVRRKEFVTRKRKTFDATTKELKIEDYQDKSQFWQALDKPGVREMIQAISNEKNNVVVFGEIFGSGVQDMTYGLVKGNWDFRVFDITVNGKYLSWPEKRKWCHDYGVEMVPVLFEGQFSTDTLEKFVSGPTTVCAKVEAGFGGREGVVITTLTERTATTDKKVFERVMLKAINFDYLERRGGTESH